MENFKKAIDMYSVLHRYLRDGYSSFLIWNEIQKKIATNLQGEEGANENASVLSIYNDFFTPTINAHKTVFLLELAKLFDRDNQTVSICILLKYIENNLTSFNKDNYTQYCNKYEKDRKRSDRYQDIDVLKIQAIEKQMIRYKETIVKVKIIRDQYLAHNDWNRKDIPFDIEDVDKLYQKAQGRLNDISTLLNGESWFNILTNEEIKYDIDVLLVDLKRSEKYRKIEIAENLEKEINNLKKNLSPIA